MAQNIHLVDRARSIFRDLGYSVEGDGREFRAERDWKEVSVATVRDPEDCGGTGDLRCFVTDRDTVEPLQRRLDSSDPEYEYAIITVEDDDYEVVRAPPTVR